MSAEDKEYAKFAGDELRAMRLGSGLTQTELGAEMQLTGATISNLEQAKTIVALPTFMRICLALGDHPSDVLRRIEQQIMTEF